MLQNLQLETYEQLSLREAVFGALRRGILRGEIPEGEHLTEIAISRQLGVSRTPVREALDMLVDAGLADKDKFRGAVVSPTDQARARELLEVMAVLECLAAERFCSAADPDLKKKQLSRLWEAAQAFERQCILEEAGTGRDVPDVLALAEMDETFHMVLIGASGSRALQETADALKEQLLRCRVLLIRQDAAGITKHIYDHHLLLQMLEKGQAKEAAQLMRRHAVLK